MSSGRSNEPAVTWRLLLDAPRDGAWNMALDEALLEGYARNPERPPTLRLYSWNPPALSLGRTQRWHSSNGKAYLRRHGIDRVRRPTGGLAVLHDAERTYAVIGSLRTAPFDRGVLETYRRIAAALVAALGSLGVPARAAAARVGQSPAERRTEPSCFQATSSHEITVEGRKLVGSAQLRRRGAFLQHGSIPFRLDDRRVACALESTASSPRSIDLATSAGRPIGAAALDAALVEAFADCFGRPIEAGVLSAAESALATRLRAWKYLAASWTDGGISAAPLPLSEAR